MTAIALLETPSHADGNETPGSGHFSANLNKIALELLAIPFLAVRLCVRRARRHSLAGENPAGNCRSSR